MKPFSSLFPVGLLVLLLLTLRLPTAAQAPAWQSARVVAAATAAATDSYSTVTATAVDAVGNVYVAGNFTNSVMIGSTTLTSLGSNDLFVAKFSPANNQFVWAQRAGGVGMDYATALAVSGTSIYIAGDFGSTTAGFGPATLTNSGPINSSDMFVAKLIDAGSTGSFVWAQQAGGVGYDNATALALSGTSVYVAGYFNSATASFGPATLANMGGFDICVAKLTDAGNTGVFVWAQRAGGVGSENATALAVNGTNVYVAGYFNSATAGFGPIILTNVGFISTSDVYVAKLTDAGSTGSFAWAQRAGGTGFEYIHALAVSGTSVYVAGYFDGPPAGFGPATLTNTGNNDVFVAKLTDVGSTGNFVWAQQAGGVGYDRATALAVIGTSVYVAGYFDGPTTGFGPATLTNAGNADVFVTKLTDEGSMSSFIWAQRAGGAGTEYTHALSVSGSSVYVAGDFTSPTANFGTNALTNPNPIPLGFPFGTSLGFLASLTDPTLTATTAATGPREPASLFPNPARQAATLRLPAGTAPAPLTLTDALGRAVRHYPAPIGTEAALDLRGLPVGLYLLRGVGPAQRLAVE